MGGWTSAELERPSANAVSSNRYEVEINRRTAAENEFVVLKKVRVGVVGVGRGVSSICHSDGGQGRVPQVTQFLGILTPQALLLSPSPGGACCKLEPVDSAFSRVQGTLPHFWCGH